MSARSEIASIGGLASLQRLAERRDLRLALFALLALATCWPILEQAANFNEFRDAQVLFSYERDAVASVREYGELPLWDPSYCGGLYALGTPQSRFASPFFLLSIIFGAQRAAPLIVFLLLMLGMEGMYRVARAHSPGAIGPLLVAPLLALQGMFAVSYFNGWVNFFGFELLPWVVVGVAGAARGERRGVVVTALSFATIVGFGGTYAGPLAALLACVEGLAGLALAGRQPGALRRALKYLSLAALLSAGASIFRLWPVYETLTTSHRIMAGTPGHSLSNLGAALWLPAEVLRGNVSFRGAYYFPALMLAFAPFALARRRGALWLALAALSLWTATGYGLGDSPFTWLRQLPLFHMIRYPERFLFVFALYASAASALGLEVVLKRAPGRALTGLVLLAGVASAAWGVRAEVQNFQHVTQGMWLAPPPMTEPRPFRQARGNRWALGYFGPQSRGSLSCWEAYPVPESTRLRADLPAEEYFADPTTGSVRRLSWSPNRLLLEVDARVAGRVLINQNYHVGWRADAGEVVNEAGLLAVDVPAGRRRVELRFSPRSAVGGGLAGLVALLVMLGLWRWPAPRRLARRRYGEALLVCAPLFAALAVRVLMPQPAPSPVPVTNADGSLALLAGVPADATPVGALFAEPVELEAVSLPAGVDDVGNARVQLFFRLHGQVSRDVGIFVHFDGRGRVAGDHQTVAASYYLADLPAGTLVGDAFSVNLRALGPGPVSVHMGLWRVGGDGTRVPVVDAGQAELRDDSLELGSFDIQ